MHKSIFTLLLGSLLLLTSCNRAIIPPVENKLENVALQRVILLIKPAVAPEVIEPMYKQYDLKAKNQPDENENRWIYTFDGSKIKAAELLLLLIENPNVEEANFYDLTTT